MGADMIAISIPRAKDAPVLDPKDPQVRADLQAAVDAWAAELERGLDTEGGRQHLTFIENEILDMDRPDDDSPTARIAAMKDDAFTVAVDALEVFGGREWDIHHYRDFALWITGGMSWGDSPTEALSELSRLDAIDLDNILWNAVTGELPGIRG